MFLEYISKTDLGQHVTVSYRRFGFLESRNIFIRILVANVPHANDPAMSESNVQVHGQNYKTTLHKDGSFSSLRRRAIGFEGAIKIGKKIKLYRGTVVSKLYIALFLIEIIS